MYWHLWDKEKREADTASKRGPLTSHAHHCALGALGLPGSDSGKVTTHPGFLPTDRHSTPLPPSTPRILAKLHWASLRELYISILEKKIFPNSTLESTVFEELTPSTPILLQHLQMHWESNHFHGNERLHFYLLLFIDKFIPSKIPPSFPCFDKCRQSHTHHCREDTSSPVTPRATLE